jgi:ABC-type spermidine/putrescine transport system permease subunit I
MLGRIGPAVCVSLALATAIHLDWHAARPTEHHLSLGLSWHWLIAVPVFGLVAWYVARAWPSHLLRASLWIVGAAVLAAGVVEPAWEYVLEDATFEWAFGQTRTVALVGFVATGIVAYIAAMSLARRQPSGQNALR